MGFSVLGGLCPGGLCPGEVSVRETPRHCTVTCGRHASYWNAFLFTICLIDFNTWDAIVT